MKLEIWSLGHIFKAEKKDLINTQNFKMYKVAQPQLSFTCIFPRKLLRNRLFNLHFVIMKISDRRIYLDQKTTNSFKNEITFFRIQILQKCPQNVTKNVQKYVLFYASATLTKLFG